MKQRMLLVNRMKFETSRLALMLVLVAMLWVQPRCAATQEIDIWEYSPYKVQVWYAIDPTLDRAGHELMQLASQQMQASFKAACEFSFVEVPSNMESLVTRDIDAINVDSFSNQDLVLLLAKDDASLKTLRVFETAVEQVSSIGMTTADHAQLLLDSEEYLDKFESTRPLLGKTTELVDSYEALLAALKDKKTSALLVPRARLAMFNEHARSVATVLPWHTERVLRDYEKLMIVSCKRRGESYEVAVRELDCPMRLFGPTMRASTVAWRVLPHLIASETVRAFAPVARIESAEGKITELLNRAGGLAEADNPVRILPGDVLQPVIRRDDRRGATTLLEPIPWTYIAVTSSNGIQIEGTTHSAMGNVLQGKQTRRAQRVALRVRPTGDVTDVKLVVRTNLSEAQPGCQIYERDLMTEELRFVGYTDWRGVITIERPTAARGILPERVRMERTAAKRKAAEEAELAARAADEARQAAEKKNATDGKSDQEPEDVRGPQSSSEPSVTPAAIPSIADKNNASVTGALQNNVAAKRLESIEASFAEGAIPLRQPLVLLYAKSGDTLLARLPLVPGLTKQEVADLPSDQRRLEAEALIRGFQGEVMDLIAERAIISARLGRMVKARQFKEAEELIRQSRRMPTYKAMADNLDAIQRRVLDESNETLPLAAKTRIDKMTQSTRDMLQKYLDSNLEQKLKDDLQKAQTSAAEEDRAAAAAAAAAAAEAAKQAEKAAADKNAPVKPQ